MTKVIIDDIEYERDGTKLLKRGNQFYRIRRGKVVQIPNDWVGHTVHPQTIRKRTSKKTEKMKKDH